MHSSALPGVVPTMIARLIGVNFAHRGGMNRLTLTSGRWLAPGARTEVVVNQRFVEARRLRLGAEVDVLLNGKLEHLTIVGTVLTPEYIYATRGGGMPDDEWFAVMWMDAEQLASAFDMFGAFNSVLLRLAHGASTDAVVTARNGSNRYASSMRFASATRRNRLPSPSKLQGRAGQRGICTPFPRRRYT